jgi:hypothetical protein
MAGRRAAGAPHAATGAVAISLGMGRATGGFPRFCRMGWLDPRTTPANAEIRAGHGSLEDRLHIARAAPYPRLTIDRLRPRRADNQPADRACITDDHTWCLRAPILEYGRTSRIMEATFAKVCHE